MNKNFCILPWIHLHIWPDNKVFPCCMAPMDMSVGVFKNTTLSDLMNSESMKKIRLDMLDNKEIPHCVRCNELDVNDNSWTLRKSSNLKYKNLLNVVKNTNNDGSLDNPIMYYWDIRFSNICNFRCRSCGPGLSSNWFEDNEKLYGKNSNQKKIMYAGDNQDKLWEELLKHIPFVEEIYFAGGEPLIMDEHYKILNKLIELKKTDIQLKYNTNLSKLKFKKHKVLDLWNKFNDIYIGASIDGYGIIGEYVRKGMNWSETEQNMLEIKEKLPHIKLGINYTISLLNCLHLPDFLNYMIDKELLNPNEFRLNYVLHPEDLRAQILSNKMKNKLRDQLLTVSNNLDEKYTKVKSEIDNFIIFLYEKDLYHTRNTFIKRNNLLDKIRNENLFDVIPELKELFNE